MPRKPKIQIKCPICKQPVVRNGADFPFCSERCRVIDLGKWASDQYVVSSPGHDISDKVDEADFPGDKNED